MPTVKTCAACGLRLTFEGAGPGACPKCGAPLGASAPDLPPEANAPLPAAEVIEEAEVLLEPLETQAGPARRARSARPRTDDALVAFASGCYWARVGLIIEALGFVLGLVLFGLTALADDDPSAARAAPPFVLFPVACAAVGALLVAWGRSSMLALGTAGGAERVLAFSAALAWFRAALLGFAVVALALAVFGGREYVASLTRGGFAVVAAGFLSFLAEATALAGLAATGAARGLVPVRDRALDAVLALQIFGSGALVIGFLLVLRGAPRKPGFEIVAYVVLAALHLWYVYAQYALYTTGSQVVDAPRERGRR